MNHSEKKLMSSVSTESKISLNFTKFSKSLKNGTITSNFVLLLFTYNILNIKNIFKIQF